MVESYLGKSFDELFEENRKYVNMTLKRQYSCYKDNIWFEDIKQCALIGLANAIETLDINKIDAFKNHIITCIRKEVLYFENSIFGAKGFSKREVNDAGIESLNISNTNNNNEGIQNERIDLVPDLDCSIKPIFSKAEDTLIDNMDLYKAIELLSKDDKKLIMGLLNNRTQKAIAKELNVSQALITQRLKKIYSKLKTTLNYDCTSILG